MRRREFLKAGGYLLAGTGLAGPAAQAMSKSDTINVGVVGTGIRGQQLMRFLREVPGVSVSSVCDVLPFRLDEAHALAADARLATDDYRRILDDMAVDAIVIAATFSEHRKIAVDALDAGKHVYCEKTMAKGIADALAVQKAANASPGLVFQTGFQYHSSPLYRTAAEIIERGDIGDIAAINCQWNRNGDWRRPVPDPRWERQINWRMYRDYSSGLVAELSAHQMDFCNTLLGSGIDLIQGSGGVDFWTDGRETYDNTHVLCRYEAGVTATFTCQTANSMDGYRIAVLGSRGSIILTTRKGWFVPEESSNATADNVDFVSGASIVDGGSGTWRTAASDSALRIDAPDTDPTPVALNEFAVAIRDNRQPQSDVNVGTQASIMVQMAIDAMDNASTELWPAAAG